MGKAKQNTPKRTGASIHVSDATNALIVKAMAALMSKEKRRVTADEVISAALRGEK